MIGIFCSYRKQKNLQRTQANITFNSVGSPLPHPVANSYINVQCKNIVNYIQFVAIVLI